MRPWLVKRYTHYRYTQLTKTIDLTLFGYDSIYTFFAFLKRFLKNCYYSNKGMVFFSIEHSKNPSEHNMKPQMCIPYFWEYNDPSIT